jgi:hypothetical protein
MAAERDAFGFYFYAHPVDSQRHQLSGQNLISFASLAEPGKMLSLSFWRDEQAVREWRRLEQHRDAQAQGRGEIFADYRLRVAGVLRDYGMVEREQAPADSRAAHAG